MQNWPVVACGTCARASFAHLSRCFSAAIALQTEPVFDVGCPERFPLSFSTRIASTAVLATDFMGPIMETVLMLSITVSTDQFNNSIQVQGPIAHWVRVPHSVPD